MQQGTLALDTINHILLSMNRLNKANNNLFKRFTGLQNNFPRNVNNKIEIDFLITRSFYIKNKSHCTVKFSFRNNINETLLKIIISKKNLNLLILITMQVEYSRVICY